MTTPAAALVNADTPRAGYYRKRRVKDGPWAAVRIWHDASRPERSAIWRAEMDMVEVPIDDVWPYCQPADRETYLYLLANPDCLRINAKNIEEWKCRAMK